jgi:hypothetical protein
LNARFVNPPFALEGNLRPQDYAAAAQTSQDGVGVSAVQRVGVYSTVGVEEVVAE